MAEHVTAFEEYYSWWVDKMSRSDNPTPSDNLHYGYSENPAGYSDKATAKTAKNSLVADTLGLDPTGSHTIADLGCGAGGTAAYMADRFPDSRIMAVNIFLPQLQLLERLGNTAGGRVIPVHDDFMHTSFEDGSLDGAYAIESSCYAVSKRDFYEEAVRVLKPGGRLVVSDVFERRDPSSEAEREMYRKSLEGWVVPSWHPIPAEIDGARTEFRDITPNTMPDITVSYRASLDRLSGNLDPVVRGQSEAVINTYYCLEREIIQYGLYTIIKDS